MDQVAGKFDETRIDMESSIPDIISSTGMSAVLYEASMRGDAGVLQEHDQKLHLQLTPSTHNTLLHVLALFCDSAECVEEILGLNCMEMVRSMILKVNWEGETAMHIAARNGREKIVEAIVERARAVDGMVVLEGGEGGGGESTVKKLLRMANKNGDTAFHEAARCNHYTVFEILLTEYYEFQHPRNKTGETPLYLAAESGHRDIVESICTACDSPAYGGPRGMTALHAAIISDSDGCTTKILERFPFLTDKADASGWTALHFAARLNHVARATQLLRANKSAAYITTGHGGDSKNALHLATECGNVEFMEEVLKHNPDCWRMNTSDGKNLLHRAVMHEKLAAIKYIISKPWAHEIVGGKDANGDTPLHLYASTYALDVPELVKHPAADVNAYNKYNFTPLDLLNRSEIVRNKKRIGKQLLRRGAVSSRRDMVRGDDYTFRRWKNVKKEKEENKKGLASMKESANTHLIVAALIATVTFAAGFTMPGGFDGDEGSDQGMAVLTKRAAFQTFVVTDTISVISSTLAVFLHFVGAPCKNEDKFLNRFAWASLLTITSMIAMILAFVTGLFCVLDFSVGLQVSICVAGSFCILILLYVFGRISKDF